MAPRGTNQHSLEDIMAKKNHTIRVYNNSKQTLQLHVRVPGSDFYSGEHQVRLTPGADVTLTKSHVNESQIANLKAKGIIKVTYDSELAEAAS